MLPSGKFQIARPGRPSRQMTMSEINLGLASGDVLPEDQYWVKGMPRWERVGSLSGVIISAAPKTRTPTTGVDDFDLTAAPASPSFWPRPETKPRLRMWSPGLYGLLSVFFTPLMGTILIAQNHRAAQETTWSGIVWFWLIVWSGYLFTAVSLHLAAIPCGPLVYWIYGGGALAIVWLFTCGLPHRRFLNTRNFEAAWRVDWGKPVGFGFLAWMVVFTIYLLTR